MLWLHPPSPFPTESKKHIKARNFIPGAQRLLESPSVAHWAQSRQRSYAKQTVSSRRQEVASTNSNSFSLRKEVNSKIVKEKCVLFFFIYLYWVLKLSSHTNFHQKQIHWRETIPEQTSRYDRCQLSMRNTHRVANSTQKDESFNTLCVTSQEICQFQLNCSKNKRNVKKKKKKKHVQLWQFTF